MKWEGREESENVEDQRGIGMKTGVALGGGGILIVLLAMLFGIDPQRLADLGLGQPKGGGGAEGLGTRGGSNAFDNFRQLEEKIEGKEAENSAMAEVEEALGKGQKAEELEAKFRELEEGVSKGAASSDVEAGPV